MTLVEVLAATALSAALLTTGGAWVLGIQRHAALSVERDAAIQRWARCRHLLDADVIFAAGGDGAWQVREDGQGFVVQRIVDDREGPAWKTVTWSVAEDGSVLRCVGEDEKPVVILTGRDGAIHFRREHHGFVVDMAPTEAMPAGGTWRMPSLPLPVEAVP